MATKTATEFSVCMWTFFFLKSLWYFNKSMKLRIRRSIDLNWDDFLNKIISCYLQIKIIHSQIKDTFNIKYFDKYQQNYYWWILISKEIKILKIISVKSLRQSSSYQVRFKVLAFVLSFYLCFSLTFPYRRNVILFRHLLNLEFGLRLYIQPCLNHDCTLFCNPKKFNPQQNRDYFFYHCHY